MTLHSRLATDLQRNWTYFKVQKRILLSYYLQFQKNILKKFFFKTVVFKLANTHKIFSTFYQHIFSKQAFFSILNEDFFSRNWMTPIPCVGSSHHDFATFMKLKIREKIKWLCKTVKIERQKRIPQKVSFFWSNSYKIEVMMTSVIDMLKLPKSYQACSYDHSAVWFESRDKVLESRHWQKRLFVITFISKYLYFKKG